MAKKAEKPIDKTKLPTTSFKVEVDEPKTDSNGNIEKDEKGEIVLEKVTKEFVFTVAKFIIPKRKGVIYAVDALKDPEILADLVIRKSGVIKEKGGK